MCLAIAAMLAALTTGGAQASTATASSAKRHTVTSISPAQATESFGLSLMHRLPAGNLVFSPDSVAAALAMTGTGAAGQTATQIARALGLSSPASFAAVGRLQQAIAAEQSSAAHGSTEAPVLDIAEGLFLQQGYPLLAPFTDGLEQAFAARPQSVDFTNPSGAEAIDAQIAQQTHGLIAHIVGALPKETRLALANAIYLKAAWSSQFPHDSAPATFHASDGARSAIFMHEKELLPYASRRGFAALALPYADSTLSLLVVLPVGQSLPAFERELNAPTLNRIVHDLSVRPVRVSAPRFHLQTHVMLNAPLQELGVRDAFDTERADFSNITQAEELVVGEAVHAADFKVDEQGTEAAASTVMTVEPEKEDRRPPPVIFNANHPFLFFLRDDHTGAVLFAGRLVKPQD